MAEVLLAPEVEAGRITHARWVRISHWIVTVGFMTLGGFFVSFMSGNSTRLGVGLALGEWEQAAHALLVAGRRDGGKLVPAAIDR